MKNGHTAVVYDKDAKAVAGLAAEGAAGAGTLEDFVAKLEKPRTAWVMLPAGKITEATIEALAKLMQPGDVIIDGGNTFWQDDVRRGAALKTKGLHYLDVGTSGGVWGIERGYCMPPGLLASQFTTLERPGADERPITVSIDAPVEKIVDDIVSQLNLVPQ